MKKLFLFALPLLALGMAACGGGGNESSSGSSSSQSSSQSSSGSGSSQSGSGSSSSQSSSEAPVSGVVITVVEPDGFQNNAKIVTWAWTGSGAGTLYDYDTTNLKFTLPDGTDHMKVLRLDPAGTYPTDTYPASGIYNNTADLEISGTTLTLGWGSGYGAEMTANWS